MLQRSSFHLWSMFVLMVVVVFLCVAGPLGWPRMDRDGQTLMIAAACAAVLIWVLPHLKP
jgi:uncharacterized membrane protein YhaH (DUF805 family)